MCMVSMGVERFMENTYQDEFYNEVQHVLCKNLNLMCHKIPCYDSNLWDSFFPNVPVKKSFTMYIKWEPLNVNLKRIILKLFRPSFLRVFRPSFLKHIGL